MRNTYVLLPQYSNGPNVLEINSSRWERLFRDTAGTARKSVRVYRAKGTKQLPLTMTRDKGNKNCTLGGWELKNCGVEGLDTRGRSWHGIGNDR